MRAASSNGAERSAPTGSRTGIHLCAVAALAVAAASCGPAADNAADNKDIPVGDTGRAAPAGAAGIAVDTAGDSVTTGAALNSTERPIQPPGSTGAGPAGPGTPAADTARRPSGPGSTP